MPSHPGQQHGFTDEVELAGHIIDSLLLPKVLDEIMSQEGRFEILKISVGQRRQDPSAARLLVSADSVELLEQNRARHRVTWGCASSSKRLADCAR